MSGLNGSEGRISSCITIGHKLLEENNPEQDQIRIRLDDTQQLWDDLKELANARQEVNIFFILTLSKAINVSFLQ